MKHSGKTKADDPRRYVIRDRDGDYFKAWRECEGYCVKRFALWTRDKTEALVVALSDLLSINFVELVCGFSALTLERVR